MVNKCFQLLSKDTGLLDPGVLKNKKIKKKRVFYEHFSILHWHLSNVDVSIILFQLPCDCRVEHLKIFNSSYLMTVG